MQQRGVVPNASAYGAVITCCEQSDRLDQALKVFQVMRQQRVDPNDGTLSLLITACMGCGLAEWALEVLRAMP